MSIVVTDLRTFREVLELYVEAHARPFVCDGSPLACRNFIVGLNAKTRLSDPFTAYWSDSTGFDREKFERGYPGRLRHGSRSRIEAVSKHIGPCLETNLYAVPSRKGGLLTKRERENPVICYLLRAIRPDLVVVHSNKAIRFFEAITGCRASTSEIQMAHWQGLDFLLYGRPDALHTYSIDAAAALGVKLAEYLQLPPSRHPSSPSPEDEFAAS